MKVMCINNRVGEYSKLPAPQLNEGQCYTVIESSVNSIGLTGYVLAEVTCIFERGFDARRFIPLSSIDETEFIREYQTEKA